MKEEYKLEDFKSELHSLCDFGCFYHCSIGGQQKPDCIETFKTNKMKEELEKLGFKELPRGNYYQKIKDIEVIISIYFNTIYVSNESNYDRTELFSYNLEKLKQLIKLLS